jgi:cytochrome c oxidase subunit 2
VGTRATIIGIAYLVVVVLGLLVAFLLYTTTRNRGPTNTGRLAERERTWLWIVVVGLGSLLFATIFYTPYGQSSGRHTQTVRATAQQFFWDIRPKTIKVDQPVEFVLRAKDVTHGFGVYRGNEFVFQAQVVPDRATTYIHTFRRPGTYRVLCLEFCGLGHANMVSSFQVVR